MNPWHLPIHLTSFVFISKQRLGWFECNSKAKVLVKNYQGNRGERGKIPLAKVNARRTTVKGENVLLVLLLFVKLIKKRLFTDEYCRYLCVLKKGRFRRINAKQVHYFWLSKLIPEIKLNAFDLLFIY